MQANSRVSPSLASPAFWAKIKMQGYRLVSITATSPTAQLFRCPRGVFMGQRPPKFRTSSVTAFSAFLSTPARKFVTLYSIIHSLICNHNFHRFHTFYCIIYKNAIGILCNVHRTAQGGQHGLLHAPYCPHVPASILAFSSPAMPQALGTKGTLPSMPPAASTQIESRFRRTPDRWPAPPSPLLT